MTWWRWRDAEIFFISPTTEINQEFYPRLVSRSQAYHCKRQLSNPSYIMSQESMIEVWSNNHDYNALNFFFSFSKTLEYYSEIYILSIENEWSETESRELARHIICPPFFCRLFCTCSSTFRRPSSSIWWSVSCSLIDAKDFSVLLYDYKTVNGVYKTRPTWTYVILPFTWRKTEIIFVTSVKEGYIPHPKVHRIQRQFLWTRKYGKWLRKDQETRRTISTLNPFVHLTSSPLLLFSLILFHMHFHVGI